MFYKSNPVHVLQYAIRQRFVPDFPDYEFGGTWKARETSKLEHKCNSELILRRSQYICVIALVNARFYILKKTEDN